MSEIPGSRSSILAPRGGKKMVYFLVTLSRSKLLRTPFFDINSEIYGRY